MAFKITDVKTRYFEFENPDNGRIIYIEPPKMNTLKELDEMQRAKDLLVVDVARLAAKLISKNKHGFKVSAEKIMQWMDKDQLQGFIGAYMSWLSHAHSTDPN